MAWVNASVANAGVLTGGTWDTTTAEQWRTVVDVNLIGTWNTCRAAIPHLVDHGGSLVNISSAAGIKGSPLHARTPRPNTVVRIGKALYYRAYGGEHPGEHGAPDRRSLPACIPHHCIRCCTGERADLRPIFQNALPS